jgi:hypothetical protein
MTADRGCAIERETAFAAVPRSPSGLFVAFGGCAAPTHFRMDEETLLAAYGGHGDPQHPLVACVASGPA